MKRLDSGARPDGPSDVDWLPRRGTRKYKGHPNAREWTLADDKFLIEHWGKLTIDEIAKQLQRTRGSVKSQAQKLNVVKRRPRWSDAEDAIIKDMWPTRGTAITARALRSIGCERSDTSIRGRAAELSLESQLAGNRSTRPPGTRLRRIPMTDDQWRDLLLVTREAMLTWVSCEAKRKRDA